MIERVEHPGTQKINVAKTFGRLLRERFEKDPKFYFFSPDETTSNRFTEVYDVESARGLCLARSLTCQKPKAAA